MKELIKVPNNLDEIWIDFNNTKELKATQSTPIECMETTAISPEVRETLHKYIADVVREARIGAFIQGYSLAKKEVY